MTKLSLLQMLAKCKMQAMMDAVNAALAAVDAALAWILGPSVEGQFFSDSTNTYIIASQFTDSFEY